jgi:dTMP kinase
MLGKLFIFEGSDGAGKSTLSKCFADYLLSIGIICEHLAFPGNESGTLGHHVYELHHDPARFGVDSITATSLQMLHIAAHVDAIERRILPTLKQGISIVLDRFWWSTWVYGVVSGADLQSLRQMIRLELLQWKQIQPEIIFLIVRDRQRNNDVTSTTSSRLEAAYRELAGKEQRRNSVCIIENNASLQEALSQIQSAARLKLQ